MFCRFCGSQLSDNASFCKTCGKQVRSVKPSDSNATGFVPLRTEIKNSIILYFIPFVYLITNIILVFVPVSEVVSWLSLGLFCGALGYAAAKRSVKFTIVFLVPYLFLYITVGVLSLAPALLLNEHVGNPVLFSLLDCSCRAVLPFAVLGILKYLSKHIRSLKLIAFFAALVPFVLFSAYLIFVFNILHLFGNSFVSQLDLLILAGGIAVPNIIAHIAYKAH